MTALLLAEPEPAARSFLERQLASDGFDVISFESPDELPRAAEPDVLVLGDAAALDRCIVPDCPVIVLGDGDPASRVRALARCDDYLSKPFLYEELVGPFASRRTKSLHLIWLRHSDCGDAASGHFRRSHANRAEISEISGRGQYAPRRPPLNRLESALNRLEQRPRAALAALRPAR